MDLASGVIKSVWNIFSREHSYDTRAYKKRDERNPNNAERTVFKQQFFRNKDSLYIYWRKWEVLPAVDKKAVVVLVHGINDHSGRFEHVAQHLTDRGYTVYSLDHQGHGRSEGDRMFVKNFKDYADDVEWVLRKAKSEYPSYKLFLLGHSMGGLVAIVTTLQAQSLLTGSLFSAPVLYLDPKQFPDYLLSILNTVAKIAPKLRLQNLDISTLTHDRDVFDAYVNDPLVQKYPATLNLQNEINKAIAEANSRAVEITLPVFMIHGTGDKLVDIEGSRRFIKLISSDDKELKEYPGGFHESLNEPGHIQSAIKDVVGWLDRH